jgi:large subunit ribosomal protein L19e
MRSKKQLAAKVLNVGAEKIRFNPLRLTDIAEAITRQDIQDLYRDGAIMIREKVGRRKAEKKKARKAGNVKGKAYAKKTEYVKITRKLRRYLKELKMQEKINQEKYNDAKQKLRTRAFKSKAHLKEYIKQ